MKRWASLTVFLYALILIFLTMPVIVLAFGKWWGEKEGAKLDEVVKIFGEWGYWLWLGIMVVGAALMLVVPVDISNRRQVSRRKLRVPIWTAAFLLAAVVFAGLFSIAGAIFGDKAFKLFEIFGSGYGEWVAMVVITISLWSLWAWIFHRITRSDEPNAAMLRLKKWLLRGSILELLVAIPCHVMIRNKENCCAPFISFWGITTGLTVMLLCFGPGVFFLFVERLARKRAPMDSPR